MIKPDEQELRRALKARAEELPNRDIVEAEAERIGIHPKRLFYILCKWTDHDEWSYGVNAMSGWPESPNSDHEEDKPR